MKKYKRFRLKAKVYNIATPQSISKKDMNAMKKKELMKIIRDHCTAENIKATFLTSEFDFKKQKSDFKTPTVISTSQNCNQRFGKYFNRKFYKAERDREFKILIADSFVPKVIETQRKVLLKYPTFKHFEKQGKKS